MTLQAADELRHPANADYHWRESVYFNFHDRKNRIGGWLYLWVLPNQPAPTGMLVSFYHGAWPDLVVTDKATAAPGHLLRSGDRWLYCLQKSAGTLLASDFDDVEFGGLHLRRREPLERYAIRFDDGEGGVLDLDCRFMTPPYDYADGVFPTPPWMAANRYHRAWWAKGALKIAGQRYDIDCTGDSDHSWGQRDMTRFGDNLFKMWSFQSFDGRVCVSALKQGVTDGEIPLGFVSLDGKMASVASVQTRAAYDADGVHSGITLAIDDALGRGLRARCPRMHSLLGWGSRDSFWGYEGVGSYDVEGHGRLAGLSSYFWPARVTPADLCAGRYD